MEGSDYDKVVTIIKKSMAKPRTLVVEDSVARITTVLGKLEADESFLKTVAANIASRFACTGVGLAGIDKPMYDEIYAGLSKALMHPVCITIDAGRDLFSIATLTHKAKVAGAIVSDITAVISPTDIALNEATQRLSGNFLSFSLGEAVEQLEKGRLYLVGKEAWDFETWYTNEVAEQLARFRRLNSEAEDIRNKWLSTSTKVSIPRFYLHDFNAGSDELALLKFNTVTKELAKSAAKTGTKLLK